MKIYYKYLSYIDDKTFRDHAVRLSSPRHLNDPFESAICKTISDELYSSENKTVVETIFSRTIDFLVKGSINQYGIVSLSETSRNLLMWAHYADEHRGICIGYKEDFLDSIERPTKIKKEGHYKPTKVMYDTLRYNTSKIGGECDDYISELTFNILTNKGNDWIYEKEHRCIVPLHWADYIKYVGKEPSELKDAMSGNSYFKSSVKIRDNDKTKEFNDDENKEYIIDDEEGLELKFRLSLDKNSIFLKTIDPSKIDRIYFGCRFPQDELDKYVSEIRDPEHCLHNVKLYKYELDKIRFELNEVRLNP